MRRYEENRARDSLLDRVFSYLRTKSQGDMISIHDSQTDRIISVCFVRRGRVNVSVTHPDTGKSELVPLERVVVI